MWEWTIKKAEHQRIDAFELPWWRRLLKVPQTARKSSQAILKEINLNYSLEGLMLKLKLQYFGHLIWRAVSLRKTLMLGKTRAGGEGASGEWDCCIASLAQWIRVWARVPWILQSTGLQRVGHNFMTEQQQVMHSVPPGKISDDWLYAVKLPFLMGFHTFRK